MPAPSTTRFNGQIKTPWRGGYTSEAQLSENTADCRDEMELCPYRLIWVRGSLPPFQFLRPGSMLPITSWGLYDGPGETANLVVNLSSEIPDLISYFQTANAAGAVTDYVYYNGGTLAASLAPGTYYMRIVSGGITYLWEPITIVCGTYVGDSLTSDPFANGLLSGTNPGGQWSVQTSDPRYLLGRILVAGNPGPAYEIEGGRVANLGDNLLYTYSSGVWTSGVPGPFTGFYNSELGDWLQFYLGAWAHFPPPVTVDASGFCFDGAGQSPISRVFLFSPQDHITACSSEVMQFAITVSGMTAGTLSVQLGPEFTPEAIAEITADGTYTFERFVDTDTRLIIFASGGFNGCITGLTVACAATGDECYYQLRWSNCGNIGNTFLGDGFTNAMYFDQAVHPAQPSTETQIETKARADGSRMETSRRRETTWLLDMGFVPWYVADALADIPLYDSIHLLPVGGGSDKLSNVRVTVENDEDISACYKRVQISFQNESASVSCCDEFDPPCRTSCGIVVGFTRDASPTDGLKYLLPGQSAFSIYSGGTFGVPAPCPAGLANVKNEAGTDEYTAIFDLNDSSWSPVATMVAVFSTPDGLGGCTINILALVAAGYRGILQYKDGGGNWADDDQYDLSETEWLNNTIQRVTPIDEGSKDLRIIVYIGDCELGHSQAFTYEC